MLYVATPRDATASIQPAAKAVSGRYLTRNPLNARGRAQLAADAIAGRVTIDTSTLTVGQIVKVCGANLTYVNEIRFPDRAKRRQQKKFAAFFDAIGADGRAELCRCIGVERIWSALTAAL